jgi:hypothetical protein
MSNAADLNLERAGHFFMLCQWIQSQMVDLIVLYDHPRIRARFVKNATTVPRTLTARRSRLWQEDFKEIMVQFQERFPGARSGDFKRRLETVYLLRNMIAHSYVSIARHYLLHRPSGPRRLRQILCTLAVNRPPNASKPILIKLDFSNDGYYCRNFNLVTSLDQTHLKQAAESIGIPHSRIR